MLSESVAQRQCARDVAREGARSARQPGSRQRWMACSCISHSDATWRADACRPAMTAAERVDDQLAVPLLDAGAMEASTQAEARSRKQARQAWAIFFCLGMVRTRGRAPHPHPRASQILPKKPDLNPERGPERGPRLFVQVLKCASVSNICFWNCVLTVRCWGSPLKALLWPWNTFIDADSFFQQRCAGRPYAKYYPTSFPSASRACSC